MVTDLISILVFVVPAIVLLVAILTLREASKQSRAAKQQTELLRKMVYGEIYEKPPLERVGFLKLKGKHDERVRFSQPIGGDIFEEVILPKNTKAPLLITWRFKEKQSLRNLSFGFGLGHNKKPRVVKKLSGWAVKMMTKPEKPLEYIDLDGYYRIEHRTPRKIGMGTPFVIEFEIQTGSREKHDFNVEIYSEEAKESFKKTLKVIVE